MKVKVRVERLVEWEGWIEGTSLGECTDTARLEATANGEVVNEVVTVVDRITDGKRAGEGFQIISSEIQPPELPLPPVVEEVQVPKMEDMFSHLPHVYAPKDPSRE